jgi:sulfofructose kinase
MKKYDVFCYGEIGVDNIIQVPFVPSSEHAAFPTGDSYHQGGAAANTAIWLANFGFSVGLSGNMIGFDWHGRQVWDWLNRYETLDLQHVVREEGQTTPFTRAMVTPDGERTFLIYGYPEAPKVALEGEMLTGAIYLALDLYGGEERLAAARAAREVGVQVTIGDIIDLEHPALPLTSIATNSAAYLREWRPGTEVEDYASRLQAVSGGTIVFTDGPDPVFVLGSDGAAFTVQPPSVPAVDATGAGDAFRAGLLAGLLSGEELPVAVCWGVAAGALKVQHLGAATTVPSLEEVKALAGTLEVRLT